MFINGCTKSSYGDITSCVQNAWSRTRIFGYITPIWRSSSDCFLGRGFFLKSWSRPARPLISLLPHIYNPFSSSASRPGPYIHLTSSLLSLPDPNLHLMTPTFIPTHFNRITPAIAHAPSISSFKSSFKIHSHSHLPIIKLPMRCPICLLFVSLLWCAWIFIFIYSWSTSVFVLYQSFCPVPPLIKSSS